MVLPEAHISNQLIKDNGWDIHNIPNAWMMSVAGHPFWLYMLTQIIKTQVKFCK